MLVLEHPLRVVPQPLQELAKPVSSRRQSSNSVLKRAARLAVELTACSSLLQWTMRPRLVALAGRPRVEPKALLGLDCSQGPGKWLVLEVQFELLARPLLAMAVKLELAAAC